MPVSMTQTGLIPVCVAVTVAENFYDNSLALSGFP